jgi:hypothetical protein
MAKDTSLTFSLYGKDVSATGAMKKVGKESDSLGKQFAKMGKVAAAGLAVAGAAAAKFAYDATKAAAEDQKSQKQLALALKNTAKATNAQVKQSEDFISKLQMTYGIADDKLRPALANLARGTGSLTKAQDLLGLAMDVSGGTGKDLEAVSMALVKAHNGNLGALKRLGIPLSDNIVKTKDFDAATKVLAKTFGGAAKTNADTFSGKLAIMQQHLNESKEQIGVALMPVIQKFADYVLETVVPNVQGFVDSLTGVKNSAGPAGKSAYEFGEKVKGVIKYISDNQDTVKTFASVVAGIFVGIKTAGIITALTTLGGAFLKLTGFAATAAGAEAAATGGASLAIAAPAIAAIAATFGAAALLGLVGVDSGEVDPIEEETAGSINARTKAKAKATAAVAKKKLASGQTYLHNGISYTYDADRGEYWSLAMGNNGTYRDYSNPHPAGAPLDGRAVGGSVMGRSSYLVGERGPEIFTPTTSGRITPNGLGGGSGMTVIVNVAGSVISEKDLAVSVRDNIAIMMRRQGLNPSILGV